MKLQSMQATFGRLDNRTLKLEPGLNVITGGNESGKSTWAEFMTAMLYGIDTRSRGKGRELPVRTRYTPWNGKPMEGRLELEWQGRNIVLERTSEQTPLGSLRAFDRDTGSPIAELTASGCGASLTGVELGVFQRSAMLRQRGTEVSSDPQLEKRLSSLVTAGSEDYAFGEVDGKLKKLQNSLQYNQSGVLPRLRSEAGELDRKLQEASALRRQQNQLLSEIQVRQAEETELAGILDRMERAKRQNLHLAALESRDRLTETVCERDALMAACDSLPTAEDLEEYRAEAAALRQAQTTAEMEDSLVPIQMPEKPIDNPFLELTPEERAAEAQAVPQLVRELRATESLPSTKKLLLQMLLILVPGLLLAISSLLFYDGLGMMSWLLLGLGVLLCIGAIAWHSSKANRIRQARTRAEQALVLYGARTADEIPERVSSLLLEIDAYYAAEAYAQQTGAERNQRSVDLRAREDAFLEKLASYDAGCSTLEDAELWLRDSLLTRQSLETASRAERQQRAQFERLKPHLTEAYGQDEPESGIDLSGYDPAVIRDRLSRSRAALVPMRSGVDRLTGALEQLGDPMTLEALRQTKVAEIERLDRRYAALQLTRKVLAEADEQLRERFAPMLCKHAGELFFRLTDGKYDRVTLDKNMQVTVHPVNSPANRPIGYLSGGTADQLYLAIRLAICDLLLPDCPIILDDALVYFDDDRLRTALRVLKELGKTRQILLFTCQAREKRLLSELAQRPC